MPAHQEQDPLVGHLLAEKYQIVRRVGHGGMGAVYEGLHVLMERPVAIKVVHSRWAAVDPSCLRRFHLEAKASSCLNHPNIMTVFDFGITSEGLAYLVMDYIAGEGLDAVLRREKVLSPERVVHIFTQACDALAHAHDKGIVHRDLKPSNIMICRDDNGREQVKIVDFGIAKFLPGHERSLNYSPRDSQVVGSPLYMSPEQCRADSHLDGRSDIYSLGCLLYQSLTGQPPICEENILGIIYAHINQLPKPFSCISPDLKVSQRIEQVVFKALAKDPADRQQSMRQLRDELQGAYYASKQSITPQSVPLYTVLEQVAEQGKLGPAVVPRLHELAEFYRFQRQPLKAEEQLRAAVKCLVEACGVWDLRVAEAVKRLADFYRDEGRYGDAEPLYLDLLAIKRKSVGALHPDIACILLRLADTYFSMDDCNNAVRYYGQCLRLAERIFGKDDPVLTPILTGYANALRRLGRDDEAENNYKRALALKENYLGPDHYDLAPTLVGLAVVYRYSNNLAEAERALQRALIIYEQSVGADHQEVASVLLLLAELYSVQGFEADAEDLYNRAVNIREQGGAEPLSLAAAYEVWAAHHLRRKDLPAAETIYKKVIALKEKALGRSHPQMADSLSVLAALYQAQKKYDDAELLYQRAVACAAAGNTVLGIRISEL
jgi:serine/threonine protein kinase